MPSYSFWDPHSRSELRLDAVWLLIRDDGDGNETSRMQRPATVEQVSSDELVEWLTFELGEDLARDRVQRIRRSGARVLLRAPLDP